MAGIQLKSVRYSEKLGGPKEWTLEGLTLGHINLIVGRNATGKSRTLNLIWHLAQALVPESTQRIFTCGYDVLFDNNGQEIRYMLHVDDGKVVNEQVSIDGELKLDRQATGGMIFTKELDTNLRFRPPAIELAVVLRRDEEQHPFLEPLHEWAAAVRHYTFGTALGKDHVALPVKEGPEANERDPNQVVGIFSKAERKIGRAFVDEVIRDMAAMGYFLDDVITCAPDGLRVIKDGIPTEFLVLGVKEKGIVTVVEQNAMSQGMFRALSILIQVNYSQMANRANCILIDDIGEGLDFERSTQLIEILRKKALKSSFQLVMTTNDKFVMNHVPLEEWSLLQRDGCRVKVRNHENSREAFEHFKFVGMSNFAFFEMDFVDGAPVEELEEEEVLAK